MRYLIPLPVPPRWRRRMIGLGSGSPTRIICSALIAQAFELVRYPILPKIMRLESEVVRREMLQIRHSSLYAPRDFDISPYFQIVKPILVENFNYKFVDWADLPAPPAAVPKLDATRNGQGVPRATKSKPRAHVCIEWLGISDDRTRSP
jgi:hypothetical protein